MVAVVHLRQALWALVGLASVLGAPTKARPSSADCHWRYETQLLDNFSPGVTHTHNATFQQRVCVYDKFVDKGSVAPPILFYTGNESPVEIYVNDTGLMWDLGRKLGAYVVFAEHRYFGESVPLLRGVKNCLAYATSMQALADYAVLIDRLKTAWKTPDSAVIAFGGSYGGMLAAWIRMKYPNVVDGAIAASAPIWGFPSTRPPLDGATQAIQRAASAEGGADPDCATFLNVLWPLIKGIAKTSDGRRHLSDSLRLCTPLEKPSDADLLIEYTQAPWFLLSEGSYPFPSKYIPFAVGPGAYDLPSWPMRDACSKLQTQDFNFKYLKVTGSLKDVRYSVALGNLSVNVDWDRLEIIGVPSPKDLQVISKVFRGLGAALGVWYNVTTQAPCYDYNGPAPHATMDTLKRAVAAAKAEKTQTFQRAERAAEGSDEDTVCTGDTVPGGNAGGWDVICCNEGLNLVNSIVQGAGNDFFWPPNVERNYDYDTEIKRAAILPDYCEERFSQVGLYGVSATADVWSKWENTYYGGLNIGSFSKIVFSNGLLDPWASAGVLVNVSDSLTAATLTMGAHHLDLFGTPESSAIEDPKEAIDLRNFETRQIRAWIAEKKVDTSRKGRNKKR